MVQNQSMSRRTIKPTTSAPPAIIPITNPPLILTPVEVVHTPRPSEMPLSQIAVIQAGISTSVLVTKPTPLVWRYKDIDIELGNKFPYAADDATNDVVDF